MIPSCTIWTIGNFFPCENQEYFPLIESNGDKDLTRRKTTTVNFINGTCFTIRNCSSYCKLWKNTYEEVLTTGDYTIIPWKITFLGRFFHILKWYWWLSSQIILNFCDPSASTALHCNFAYFIVNRNIFSDVVLRQGTCLEFLLSILYLRQTITLCSEVFEYNDIKETAAANFSKKSGG